VASVCGRSSASGCETNFAFGIALWWPPVLTEAIRPLTFRPSVASPDAVCDVRLTSILLKKSEIEAP